MKRAQSHFVLCSVWRRWLRALSRDHSFLFQLLSHFLGERSAFWFLLWSNTHTAIYLLSYSNKTRPINKHNGSENNALVTQKDCAIVYGMRFCPLILPFGLDIRYSWSFIFVQAIRILLGQQGNCQLKGSVTLHHVECERLVCITEGLAKRWLQGDWFLKYCKAGGRNLNQGA